MEVPCSGRPTGGTFDCLAGSVCGNRHPDLLERYEVYFLQYLEMRP